MGLFDSLKNVANNIGAAAGSDSQTFTFNVIPQSTADLKALPEASLDTPYKTTALAILALLCYEANPDGCFEMIDFLNGPDDVSAYSKSFIKDRLTGKMYKVSSFFAGATVDNNYTPNEPLVITVSSNPHSFEEENYATMYVKSSGADSERPVKLRKKPSTGEWFLVEYGCLSDIRVPKAADPWA